MISEEKIAAIIKDAVKESIAEYHCFLTPEEKAIVKDMADAGKIVKKTILGGVAMALLYLIIQGVILVKGWFSG